MEENVFLRNRLEVSKAIIHSLKDRVVDYSNKIVRLEARATLAEVQVEATEIQLP